MKCNRCQAPDAAVVQCLIDAEKGTMQVYLGETPIASEDGRLMVGRFCPNCARSFLADVRAMQPADDGQHKHGRS